MSWILFWGGGTFGSVMNSVLVFPLFPFRICCGKNPVWDLLENIAEGCLYGNTKITCSNLGTRSNTHYSLVNTVNSVINYFQIIMIHN